MIRPHQLHRFRREQPHAVEFPAVEEHLQQAPVVARGREHTRAARKTFPRPRHVVALVTEPEHAFAVDAIDGREPRRFLRRQKEARIDQLQRSENPLRKKFIQRHSRHHFHEIAKHIARIPVLINFPGLAVERERREPLDRIANRLVPIGKIPAGELRLLVDVRRRSRSIGQPRRVREQITDLNRPLRFHRHKFRPSRRTLRRRNRHHRIFELGDIFRNRIVQQKPAFLVEHHDCGRRHGLAHRRDAENRVGRHRLTRLDVTHSIAAVPHFLPVARDVEHHARNFFLIHLRMDHRIEPREARSVEPHRRRIGDFGPARQRRDESKPDERPNIQQTG